MNILNDLHPFIHFLLSIVIAVTILAFYFFAWVAVFELQYLIKNRKRLKLQAKSAK